MSFGVPLKDAVLLHVADPHEDLPESASVQDHLGWHGIHSEAVTRPKRADPVGAVLVEAADDLHCGLLVMGGYGHFRNWEAVFGGITRYMIRHAPLPLLMMH
jgi:nucleotide-binding universal stress UspA family protein